MKKYFLFLLAICFSHFSFAASTSTTDNRIRVQFAPLKQSTLSAEIAAKISSLPFKEGDTVRSGQTLVSFDCSLFQAQLNKAQATVEAAKQTLKVNQRLSELGSASNLEVDQASGKAKEAEAEVSAMRATIRKCSISAPFSGRIAKKHVEAYEFVSQGKPIVDLIDHSLEIKLVVPSRWLSWLKKDARFTIQVDELGRAVTAKVTRFGVKIDPVSQSINVVAQPEGKNSDLLPGMSGWATFEGIK